MTSNHYQNVGNKYRNLARAVSVAGMLCGAGMIAYGFYQGSKSYQPLTVQRSEQLSLELKDTRIFLTRGSTLSEIIENSPFTDFKPEVKKHVGEYLALHNSGLVQDMNLYSKREIAAMDFLFTSTVLFIISFQALGYTFGTVSRGGYFLKKS